MLRSAGLGSLRWHSMEAEVGGTGVGATGRSAVAVKSECRAAARHPLAQSCGACQRAASQRWDRPCAPMRATAKAVRPGQGWAERDQQQRGRCDRRRARLGRRLRRPLRHQGQQQRQSGPRCGPAPARAQPCTMPVTPRAAGARSACLLLVHWCALQACSRCQRCLTRRRPPRRPARCLRAAPHPARSALFMTSSVCARARSAPAHGAGGDQQPAQLVYDQAAAGERARSAVMQLPRQRGVGARHTRVGPGQAVVGNGALQAASRVWQPVGRPAAYAAP